MSENQTTPDTRPKLEDCQLCNGSGDCAECEGNGLFESGVKCEFCGGSGICQDCQGEEVYD